MDFWERTKSCIKRLGTNQNEIARDIGVSTRTFRGWMSRLIMPNADQVFMLARVLKVDPEWLVFGTYRRSGNPSVDLPTGLHQQVAAKLSELNESQLKTINALIDEFKKS